MNVADSCKIFCQLFGSKLPLKDRVEIASEPNIRLDIRKITT